TGVNVFVASSMRSICRYLPRWTASTSHLPLADARGVQAHMFSGVIRSSPEPSSFTRQIPAYLAGNGRWKYSASPSAENVGQPLSLTTSLRSPPSGRMTYRLVAPWSSVVEAQAIQSPLGDHAGE